MASAKPKLCCSRFRASVEEGYIIRADGYDETEWFASKWFHFYYCPFCGTNIKGKGWGRFDILTKNRKKKKNKKRRFEEKNIHFDFSSRSGT